MLRGEHCFVPGDSSPSPCRSQNQRCHLVRQSLLHQVPPEHAAHRILEFAQIFLPEPPLPHRPPLFRQKTRPNPRTFRCRRQNPIPLRSPARPLPVKEPPLPIRRAHQPQRPIARRQHGAHRHVHVILNPRCLVQQQQCHRRKSPNRR